MARASGSIAIAFAYLLIYGLTGEAALINLLYNEHALAP
jgi:hypothetical protein